MEEAPIPELFFRRPTVEDYAAIQAVIPLWWQTSRAATLGLVLPRLFLEHFTDTSTIAEDEAGELAGFLIGFRSQSQPEVAYIHFVGVRPDQRHAGLARTLYERFFAQMRGLGCERVDAITGVQNVISQRFHRAMGFELGGDSDFDGVLGWRDYDGPGEHRVTFTRRLD